MYGKLVDAWPYTWEFIWIRLTEVDDCPVDLFMQLYAELRRALKEPADSLERGKAEGIQASIENDPTAAQGAFSQLQPEEFRSDVGLRRFFESAFQTLADFGIPVTCPPSLVQG
jgi:hypothetical protein